MLCTHQMLRPAIRLLHFELEPAMYLPEWLMPLWTRSLDAPVVSHLFNLLYLEGDGELLSPTA